MIKFYIIFLYLIFFTFFASGQQIFSNNTYPLVDFRRPLDITPPALSGSFGEIRAGHFHSGVDFRTHQKEGYPVYAVADGYISRIKIQNSGFGLALYINHPNGYTTVYGHLQRFNPKIAARAKEIEYAKKSFEIDDFPDSTLIPVYKGEVIAYSGNRGSSGGPHLHFEIRDTKTEATINPQLFGMGIPDTIPPVIHAMYVYRLNNKPFNQFTPKQYFQVTGRSGKYHLNKVSTINLNGDVGFGIIVTDKHNGASGTNGVYAIELQLDGKTVFTSSLERFSFENSNAVNSHIDYPAFVTTKRTIQKSFVDPGNPLKIYSNLINHGRIEFTDGKLHELKYIIIDAKGNKSILPFKVRADDKSIINTPQQPKGSSFPYNKTNEFNNDEVKIILPKATLYDDLNFIYKKLSKPAPHAFSAIHQIQSNQTPLFKGFKLWIKADTALDRYKDKALIVNTNGISQGGHFENGYVTASPGNFGSFFITIDTIPPTIVPINITDGKHMESISKMTFKIRDNLSGIKSFDGYIDDQWILMEFDAKTATLWHTFDERTTSGKHTLRLIVTDRKDNIKTYSITFYK